MTKFSALVAAALTLSLAPAVGAAPGPAVKTIKPGNPGHPGKLGRAPGNKTVASVSGAGKRNASTFGGRVRKTAGGKVLGAFHLSIHPDSPAGSTLDVACTFDKFSSLTVEEGTATFQGTGKCRRLMTDGTIETVAVENAFTIVDREGQPDAVDIDFVGPSGVMVPGGELSFGDFTVTG